MSEFPSVSVVIPVWNAESYLKPLLTAILNQKGVSITEILLLDSMSTDQTVPLAGRFSSVTVIPEPDFSHGGTRNRGIALAKEDRVILMTQDALPQDEACFAHLISALDQEKVAYAFSRQTPYPKTNPMEVYYLREKFPAEASRVFQTGEIPVTSPDQSFCSNVCSAIRKSVWSRHHFRDDLIMGEDQDLSCQLQEAGYSVVYAADSVVIHSHNYPLLGLFRRYFDSVVAITQLFPQRPLNDDASSGIEFLRCEFLFLLRHHPAWLFYYPFYLGVKTLATVLGHRANRLPLRFKVWCSLNRSYWKKHGVA